MNDYKELIEDLRDDYKAWGDGRPLNFFEVTLRCKQAADAIEQLANDRNASVDALKAVVENVDAVPTRSGHWLLKFHDEETEEAIRLIIALCAEQNGTEVSE